MTRSHRCWFITNIWKSDHRLNITLGTDKIHSQLSICYIIVLMKGHFVLFQTQKLWSKDNLITNGQGLSSDTDSAALSVSHKSVTSTFRGQPLLSNNCGTKSLCSQFMPLKGESPATLPKFRLMQVHIRTFSHFTAGRYDSTCAFVTDCH